VADYLLDTNILSYWYDDVSREHVKVVARIKEARQPDPTTGYVSRFFVSVVTLGEIEYGARVSHVDNPVRQAE
jgi:predicted nucleic acid-binding protein